MRVHDQMYTYHDSHNKLTIIAWSQSTRTENQSRHPKQQTQWYVKSIEYESDAKCSIQDI